MRLIAVGFGRVRRIWLKYHGKPEYPYPRYGICFRGVMKLSENELRQRQSLPLTAKIKMTERRISEFVEEYGLDGVYISFSGGKDSTVLLHIARRLYPDIKAVYVDGWMDFPQIRQFVKKFDNVDVIKPKKTMKQIIEDDGWCFPSKDVSEMIEAARRDVPWAIRKLNGLDKDGKPSEYRQQYKKWKPLVDAPVKISSMCCMDMKELPIMEYEKETGRHPIIAIMADESARRKEAYLRTGCNTFDTKQILNEETGEYETVVNDRPQSKPMGFWLEQDVLAYIYKYHIPIASPYGFVTEVGQTEGQISLFPEMSECANCKLCTSGEKRTGCMFCPVGCHIDKFKKFKRLKQYNPALFEYCMYELKEIELIHWIAKTYNIKEGMTI